MSAAKWQQISSGHNLLNKIILSVPSFMIHVNFGLLLQDILRCRVLTSGIFETRFTVEKVNFQ